MLADNRMESVMGRIKFLTSSINTMKFMRELGVPKGVMWIIICLVLDNHPIIKVLIHIVMAIENEIEIWAVVVKMKGNRANKFCVKINKNMVFINISLPFLEFFLSIVLTSFLRLWFNIANILLNFNWGLNFNGTIIIIGNKRAIKTILFGDWDGSKIEKRLFIMFIYKYAFLNLYFWCKVGYYNNWSWALENLLLWLL